MTDGSAATVRDACAAAREALTGDRKIGQGPPKQRFRLGSADASARTDRRTSTPPVMRR
jgi:hypothetical protein